MYKYFAGKLDVDDYSGFMDIKQKSVRKKKFHDQLYYKNVEIRDLFGTEKFAQSAQKKNLESVSALTCKLKHTDLKLELKGTITGTGSDPFAVIIKKGDKKEILYTIGDAVDHAVIKAIFKDKVILLVDGKEEVLIMKQKKTDKTFTSKTLSSANYDALNSPQNNNQGGEIDNVSLTWTEVEKFTNNLSRLKKQIRANPHFYKGKMDGFRITGIQKNSVLYKKLGLKNGDIIEAVNGEKIKSGNDALKIYTNFKKMNGDVNFYINVKRKGLNKTIRYSIR